MLSGLKKIWNFAGVEKKNLNKSVFLEFIHAIFNMLQIGAIYLVLQALVSGSKDPALAWKTFALLLLSILGRALLNYFAQLQQCHAGYFMVAEQRIKIAQLLKTVPMGYFNEHNTGHITGVLTTVLDDAENTAPGVLVLMMGGYINALVFTLMLLGFEWRIGLIVVIGSLLYLYLTSRMEKIARKLAPARQKAQSDLVEAVLEYIQGLPVVKSFNLSGKGDKAVRAAVDESRRANLELEKVFTPHIVIHEIVLRVASVLMIACSLYFYFQGSLDLLKCLMCIVMSFLIFSSIQSAGSAMATLRVATSSIEQAEEAENMPQMDIAGEDIRPRNVNIEFQDVNFSYETRPILKNISVKIPQHSVTAIVGPSGSGKTSMCSLISRFWDVDSGSISIGGVDIRKYTLSSLMDLISSVFQGVYLFHDSIENNIKFGQADASHEDVVAAAKKAQCHDFIMALPEGYQTILGEGGCTLSGGEKQRISIARAILKDAPIIVFDEATANVDPENEYKLQKAMENLSADKTVIMIAHRLKTIRNASQILVLDQGEVVERGKHEELIAQGGLYKRLIADKSVTENWHL